MIPQTSLLTRSLISVLLAALACSIPALAQKKKKAEDVTLVKCWDYEVESGIDVATGPTGIYIARDGGVVEALSLAGTKVWSTELGGTIVSNVEPKFASLLVVTAAADGTAAQLRSLSAETGLVKWSVPVRPAKKYNVLYFEVTASVIADDGVAESFEASSGKPVVASVVPGTETLTGDERGNVIRTVSGKQVWKYRTGGAITHSIELDDMILAASQDNFVYAIERSNGHVRWRHRLPGRVASMQRLGADMLLVSSWDDPGIKLLELRKGRSAGGISLNGEVGAADIEPVGSDTFLVLAGSSLSRYAIGACSK